MLRLLDNSRVGRICNVVAPYFGLEPERIRRRTRRKDVQFAAHARQVAMYFAHEQGMSLQRVGIVFGGYDHTTVLHALRMVRQAQRDREFKQTVNMLRQRIAEVN